MGAKKVIEQDDDIEISGEVKFALDLMREWRWIRYDPDGVPSASPMSLREAVNRLALEGHASPKRALLDLFCNNKIAALASYRWRKFQKHDYFQLEGSFTQIGVSQWRALAAALQEIEQNLQESSWPFTTVDLEKLELSDCEIADWQPEHDRFSYAFCPPETPVFDPSYFEEFYSAWDVTILPLKMPGRYGEIVSTIPDGDQGAPDDPSSQKSPLSDAELDRWWESRAKVRDHLTKDELLTLVRAKYPDRHISRDRIRDLAGPRKTGPKTV